MNKALRFNHCRAGAAQERSCSSLARSLIRTYNRSFTRSSLPFLLRLNFSSFSREVRPDRSALLSPIRLCL